MSHSLSVVVETFRVPISGANGPAPITVHTRPDWRRLMLRVVLQKGHSSMLLCKDGLQSRCDLLAE